MRQRRRQELEELLRVHGVGHAVDLAEEHVGGHLVIHKRNVIVVIHSVSVPGLVTRRPGTGSALALLYTALWRSMLPL